MLYLVTGSNGAGKTLFTLKWVRDRQLKENRPVCYNGRFEPVPGGELESWKKIDFKDWQSEPDGTIFLIDECHNDLPTRPNGSLVPEPIKMLAEHRRRGFDFYLVTQHPSNLDAFVRKLIGSPGWHRHLKRVFGAGLVSILEWNYANNQCETHGSGKSADVSTAKFPSEVFGWYRSASLHTAKKTLPKKVWIGVAALVVAAGAGWRGYSDISSKGAVSAAPAASAAFAARSPEQQRARPMTAEEYAASYAPRVAGLPHSAPRFDRVTEPVHVPVPAACIDMPSKGCKCYTQQATRIAGVSAEMCRQIVANGFFEDFARDSGATDKQKGDPLAGAGGMGVQTPHVEASSSSTPRNWAPNFKDSRVVVPNGAQGTPAPAKGA